MSTACKYLADPLRSLSLSLRSLSRLSLLRRSRSLLWLRLLPLCLSPSLSLWHACLVCRPGRWGHCQTNCLIITRKSCFTSHATYLRGFYAKCLWVKRQQQQALARCDGRSPVSVFTMAAAARAPMLRLAAAALRSGCPLAAVVPVAARVALGLALAPLVRPPPVLLAVGGVLLCAAVPLALRARLDIPLPLLVCLLLALCSFVFRPACQSATISSEVHSVLFIEGIVKPRHWTIANATLYEHAVLYSQAHILNGQGPVYVLSASLKSSPASHG